jgi:hypothetical protein
MQRGREYPEQELGPARVEQSALEQVHLEQVHAGKVAALGRSGGFAFTGFRVESQDGLLELRSHCRIQGQFELVKLQPRDAQSGTPLLLFWAMRS